MEYVVLGVTILVVSGLVAVWLYWRAQRQSGPKREMPTGTELGGYGKERWEREIAVWEGTLRRLERQARQYDDVPAYLQQQIDTARERIVRAREALTQAERQG